MTSQTDGGSGLDWDPFPGQSFGVNGALVWIFLDELRELDLDRAIEVWDAYAVAQQRGHAEARAAAEHAAQKQRPQAWAAAREAASIAVRERLGAASVTTEVADILADVAGSLVVRDLLPRPQFRLLQLPWTGHGGAAEPEPAIPVLPSLEDVLARTAPAVGAEIPVEEAAPVVGATPGFESAPMPDEVAAGAAPAYAESPASRPAAAFTEAPGRSTPFRAVTASATATARPTVGATLGRAADRLASNRFTRTGVRAIVVIAVVTVLAIVTRLAPDAALVGPSNSEVPGSGALVGTGPTPGSSGFALASPSTRPTTSSAPGSTAGPKPTKAPTATSAPPPPRPTPRPTPVPTPTPKTICTVPLLIGLSTGQAPHRWSDAGFTGTVFFSPEPPPNYKIQSQSLTPGSKTTCTHGVNVTDHAP